MRLAQVATASAAAATTGAGTADGGKTDVSAAQAAAQAHLTLCEARCLVRAMLRMPSSLEQGKLPAFPYQLVCAVIACTCKHADRHLPLIPSRMLLPCRYFAIALRRLLPDVYPRPFTSTARTPVQQSDPPEQLHTGNRNSTSRRNFKARAARSRPRRSSDGHVNLGSRGGR